MFGIGATQRDIAVVEMVVILSPDQINIDGSPAHCHEFLPVGVRDCIDQALTECCELGIGSLVEWADNPSPVGITTSVKFYVESGNEDAFVPHLRRVLNESGSVLSVSDPRPVTDAEWTLVEDVFDESYHGSCFFCEKETNNAIEDDFVPDFWDVAADNPVEEMVCPTCSKAFLTPSKDDVGLESRDGLPVQFVAKLDAYHKTHCSPMLRLSSDPN